MLSEEVLSDLRNRASSAAIIPFREVWLKAGAPQYNKCHENVAAWVEENAGHKPVRGWLVMGLLLNAHSVVADIDGAMFDITPLQTPQRLPFLPHLGSESEFRALPAEIHLVQFSI
jgi:hypothetical protein